MKDFKNEPIFVTGIERSGSSIIAKIIGVCGAHVGSVSEMQENLGIKNLVNTYYIRQLGIPSNGQRPLPDTKQLITPYFWKGEIDRFLFFEGYEECKPWMYKSSRICQLWPIWNELYPNAKWVIVRRRTGDIIQSCLKTGFMKAYKDSEGWLDWIHQHEELFTSMVSAKISYIEVWPERMAQGDYSQIHEMLEWLGLECNDSIPNIVLPLLKNSPQKVG